MMKVKLKISTGLRYYVPGLGHLVDGAEFEVKEGSTVGQILEMIHLPHEVATTILVNGLRADKDKCLSENDQLYLIQPTTGG